MLPEAAATRPVALLVILGADSNDTGEPQPVATATREGAESWLDVLRKLRVRGMRAPELAAGDAR